MRTRQIALTLLTAGAPAFAACENGSPFEPEPEFVQVESAAELVDMDAFSRAGSDAGLFDQLARDIPGFAGFWFDRACNLNVVLTDLAQSDKAKEILTPYLQRYLAGNPRCPDLATIIVHQGEYSWVQLSGWLDLLRPAAALPGVKRIGISIQQNRIMVGVDGRPTARRVLEIAQRQGVPGRALKFFLAAGSTTDSRRNG